MERKYLNSYNKLREKWRAEIEENGGKLQRGGRTWYKGTLLPSDHVEEFAEDMTAPLKDLSAPRGKDQESDYAYSMDNVTGM